MSNIRGSEHPLWINIKKFNRKELETLKEILPFYIINTIQDSYSYRGFSVEELGWPSNIWNTGALKDQLFHVANLTVGYNLRIAQKLDEMSDACKLAHLENDFYHNYHDERIAIYVDSHSNLVLSIFKHIRNALAHGRFIMVPMGDDYSFVMESVDNNKQTLIVKARIVLKASTLLKWKEIVLKGPQEENIRKRKKK